MNAAAGSRYRARRAGLLLVTIAMVAACSSVTRPVQLATEDSTGQAASTTMPGPATADTVVGPDATTPGPGGTAVPKGSTAGPGGSGSCEGTIKLGVSYSSDAAASEQQVGGETGPNAFSDNVRRLYQLGADDLNRHGGIGGCQVALSFFDFRQLSTSNFDQQSQAECAHFTDDEHVFAAVPQTLESHVYISCMAAHQTGVLVPHMAKPLSLSAADFATGYLFAPSEIAWDRLGGEIELLKSAGYFDAGAKVGVLIVDDSSGIAKRLVDQEWAPRLQRLGIPLASKFTFQQISSFASVGPTAQQMNNAVLQFRSAGVTHVILGPGSGGGYYFFASAADAQGYHPRIAADSTHRVEEVIAGGIGVSSNRAVVVSWEVFDASLQSRRLDIGRNDVRTQCDAVYRDAVSSVGLKLEEMYPWCDVLNVLELALAGTKGKPTVQGLRAGIERLGTIPSASGVGASSFGPGHFDGGSQVRLMQFTNQGSGCCFDYITGPQPLPK